ncbi:MAG TPA: hypothetical protein DD379_02900, partial [Cyanobacteria bacterium UBA11162]|nr:hypothetical protein [Cyanobacteria bacterium UBA11162]
QVVRELASQARDFIKYKLQQPSGTEVLIRRLESRIEQGELQIRVRSIESDRALKRIYLGIKSLIYACLTGFTLLAGTVLLLVPHTGWAIAAFTLSGVWFVILLNSLVRLGVKERLDKLVDK